MRLGFNTGYSGPRMAQTMELILEAERLGYDSVWSGEAYGSDVITFLAWVGARTSKIKLGAGIMQMHARTPAMAAMTAMTLDGLSNGRFIIGLGPSNPQVVEGWHGVPYGKPLQRYREYIEIMRMILKREQPLQFDGKEYQIPYRGAGRVGAGQAAQEYPARPRRHEDLHGVDQPQGYRAGGGTRRRRDSGVDEPGVVWAALSAASGGRIHEGRARQEYRELRPRAVRAVHMGNDLDRCRAPVKASLALYIGGMGARNRNFYNSYVRNFGYEDLATQLQDLYLSGRKEEAAGGGARQAGRCGGADRPAREDQGSARRMEGVADRHDDRRERRRSRRCERSRSCACKEIGRAFGRIASAS